MPSAFSIQMEDSGRYNTEKGCFGRMSLLKKVSLIGFIFLATFFIGFGIGFGAGNVAPPIVYKYLQLPTPPPPAPWWQQPPPPAQLQWAMPAGYRRQPSAVLSSLSPAGSWGYLTYDSSSSRLFVGLLNDSLVSLTVSNGTINGSSAVRVPGTVGCNGMIVAGALGFCGNAFAYYEGSNIGNFGPGITVVNLTSLAAVRTVPVARGVGVNNGAYDAVSNQARAAAGRDCYARVCEVLMTLVNGSIVALNATTGNILRTVDIPGPAASCGDSTKMCDPLGDVVIDPPTAARPTGFAYITAPTMSSVLQLNLNTLAVTKTFALTPADCDTHGLALDSAGRRLFLGCGNPYNPNLLSIDADQGTPVSPPIKIGRGVFAVKYDAARQHVYASSGVAGNIAVIRATPGATPYNVREAVFTKAGTRTMAFDPNSGAIFTAAPDGRYNPRMPVNEDLSGGVSFFPNDPYPNTMEVMSFRLP